MNRREEEKKGKRGKWKKKNEWGTNKGNRKLLQIAHENDLQIYGTISQFLSNKLWPRAGGKKAQTFLHFI